MVRGLAAGGRRLAHLGALLLLCVATPVASPALELGLAPVQADPELAPIAPGLGLWLQVELLDAGHTPVPLAGGADPSGRAAARGLAHVLIARLQEQSGTTRIQLVLYATGPDAPLAGVRRAGPTAELGQSAARALSALLPQLGGTPGREPAPPLLEDLACTGAALRARAGGDLVTAWRALEGKLSPLAVRLREQIAFEARSSDAPAAERARVLAASGDLTGAWGLIGRRASSALDGSDPDVGVLLAAGEVSLARGDARAARRYFERLLAGHPEHPDAMRGMARVLERQGDAEASRAWTERALRIDREDPELAVRLASAESDPARAAQHWLEAGRRAARRLEVQHARGHFERAVSLSPGSAPTAHGELGALEQRLGRPAESLAAYRRALDGGDRSPVVLTAIGRAERRLGRSSASEQSLRGALELAPESIEARRELGALYLEIDRVDEATALLQAAYQQDPADGETRRNLAQALRATGDTDEALALLDGRGASAEDLDVAAAIRIERGDLQGARETLDRALALEPDDPALRNRLAELHAAAGDPDAARQERERAAVLDAELGIQDSAQTHTARSVLSLDDLVASFAAQVPRSEERRIAQLGVREPGDWRTRVWRLLRPRSPDRAALEAGLEAAIDARFQLAPMIAGDDEVLAHHIDRLYRFEREESLNAATIGTLNQVLVTDGALLTRLIAHDPEVAEVCGPDAFAVEMRLLTGRDADLVSILSNFDCLDGGFGVYGRWNAVALGLYGLLALLLCWPLLRGWGAVQVLIRLPDRTKGFFSIHITTRPDQVKREQVDKKTKRKKTRAGRLDFLKRFERHMAGRDTRFRWIPARKAPYTVTVAGPLLDARGEEIIGHFLEEQQVRVRRGRNAVLDFDFRPKECAVEVRISVHGEPARGARVAVQGDPQSLRYARDGVAFLYLGLGSYTILAGSHAAAARFPLDVTSLDSAIPLQVELGEGDGVLFRDCPEAVDAFVQSDLDGAARALDAAGNAEAAHLVRAEHFRQQGRSDEAARELEAAGRLGGAAELRASGDDHQGSASLFEQAGDPARAAEAYRAAGEWTKAARCYEQAYDWGNAVECWREAGDTERELEMLEKLGEFMDAAMIARELGDRERALHNLQQIDSRHHMHGTACRVIAELASEAGDHDFAISKLEEGMASLGAENASVETLEVYASVLARAGRASDAISAWEAIRRRDASRTDAVDHIQALKQQLSASQEPTRASGNRGAPQESRYELLGEIGRGGMGVVYKARDKRLGRTVALKRLPENLRDHPSAVALFEREARAAAALNHVNIVTLFDAGEENGCYFITMELLEGKPLNAILERRGRIGVRVAARLGTQICAGLHYAHERRIVHRDIKTANLFFTVDHTVKIMDFGIAKSLEEVRRSTTVVGGTPYYMAPEQASGEGVDHRADLYALGVTLFQLVTGALPFPDGDVSYRHRHEAPPDPRELNLELPGELAALILELMAKDPQQRPADAAAVGARLAGWASARG